ncbi:hypothetical protein LWC33_23500 [Pseudonocardia sp. RS11V-5]|uniref:hypothetical protein n=1 Tax=Pseudonocardia terrae TaxID=2905831 RepID=UPI001E4B3F34|nr:hypothetical protein [Pseudonocardia terrae]MCE3554409.1 hypothetical protein [Pseudonocardia terrae]
MLGVGIDASGGPLLLRRLVVATPDGTTLGVLVRPRAVGLGRAIASARRTFSHRGARRPVVLG